MTTTISISTASSGKIMLKKVLLSCGILASILYGAMNIICALLYEGYSSFSQTVSELSAIDAPTRPLWFSLGLVYALLVTLFGWGVWKSSGNRPLRIVGILLFVNGLVSFFWPPMHQREMIAAGGGTLTDTMHIVFSFVTVFLMMLAIGFSAAAFGKKFRVYSIVTLIILFFFGGLTGMQSPALEANLPTPWMGVWERICIGAFLVWMSVLAVIQLREGSLDRERPLHKG